MRGVSRIFNANLLIKNKVKLNIEFFFFFQTVSVKILYEIFRSNIKSFRGIKMYIIYYIKVHIYIMCFKTG